MKAKDIKIGSVYAAKVSGMIVPVRVDGVREVFPFNKPNGINVYDVTNLVTKRRTTFKSAAKLRYKVNDDGSMPWGTWPKHCGYVS